MVYMPIEHLLKNTKDSMYKLVILAARRSLELGTGSEKLVDAAPNTKLTSVALREIEQEKISYKLKKAKPE